jgi:Putative auto-transporter adhesin, head GIN domain
MKKIISMFALASAIVLTGCSKKTIIGSGSIVSQDKAIGNFNNITLQGSLDVNITKGDSFSVKVRGYENLIKYAVAELQGNTLVVKMSDEVVNISNNNLSVEVTMPVYQNLLLTGSGDINVKNSFPNLQKVSYKLVGSGDITASASIATSVLADLDGSGDISVFGVVADSIVANLAGSGDVNVTPVTFLKATLVGSGDITYENNPLLQMSKTGSGSIKKK